MLTSERLTKDLLKVLPKNQVLTSVEERYAYSQDALNVKDVENLADAVVLSAAVPEQTL